MHFEEQTIRVTIDESKCVDCVGYKPESQCELVCPVGACVLI